MRQFFEGLTSEERRRHPSAVTHAYGSYMWSKRSTSLIDDKKASRSRFYVGLSAQHADFPALSKRATLIADTFVLSDHAALPLLYERVGNRERFHSPGDEWLRISEWRVWYRAQSRLGRTIRRWWHDHSLGSLRRPDLDAWPLRPINTRMYCADPAKLGQWIKDAEPLLTAGLAWYLPVYLTRLTEPASPALMGGMEQLTAVDYLVADGRAIDASGAEPIKSALVRPILRIDLPFIDGIDLRQFGRITVDEFDSYRGFRDFLRQSFLDLDEALNANQSERALAKIGLEIADQIRSVRAEMNRIRRNRAVSASGAVIGATAAILVAVYGPALEQAIAAIGATGGIWGLIRTLADTTPRSLHHNKWYYAWALSQQATNP